MKFQLYAGLLNLHLGAFFSDIWVSQHTRYRMRR